MMLRVQFFQALTSHMRIDLCGRQIAMSEQHLHDPEISTVIQQMRGKCMAQRVRGQVFIHAGLLGIALNDVPERLARHGIAATSWKKAVGLAFEQDLETCALCKIGKPLDGFLAERNEALTIALADNA